MKGGDAAGHWTEAAESNASWSNSNLGKKAVLQAGDSALGRACDAKLAASCENWRPAGADQEHAAASCCRTPSGYRSKGRREIMRDVIFVAITIAFFALSIAYVKFCERVR